MGVYGQFLRIVLPVSALVFALVIALFEWSNFSNSQHNLIKKLSSSTQIYSLLLAKPIAESNINAIKLFTSYLITDPDISSFRIVDNNGSVIESFSSKDATYATKSEAVYYATEVDIQALGTLYISVTQTRIINELKQRMLGAIILLASLLLAMLISIKFAYRKNIGLPLRRLTQAIQTYNNRGKHTDILTSGNNELSTVIHTYNRMQQAQIKTSSELQLYQTDLENIVEKRTTELLYQANHDSLTGLKNRREFNKLLHQVAKKSSTCALFYMDLDQFKLVNDTCGHTAGDHILCQVASLLTTHIRENDTIARLGGDEFAVLLYECNEHDALKVGEKILASIAENTFFWKERKFRLGISIGIVMVDADNNEPNDLLKTADASCYMAKEKGRNRIHLYRESEGHFHLRRREMQWATQIQEAIDDDLFELWKQPIINLKESDESWVEILIRLKMPDGTTYLPESFLPAAERYGLAVKIDHWVLKNTIKLIQDQHPHDHSRYSINISGHTVSDKEFLPYAIALLEESGIDPSAICFEITETAVISDLKAAEVLIDHLKAKGCLFALDDFGTGASSFTYLNALDLDYLKIDGSFVTNITHNEIEREILRAINKIGQLSGMKTIAEYLENKETLEILNEIGVDYAQGYYYGEPREADMK